MAEEYGKLTSIEERHHIMDVMVNIPGIGSISRTSGFIPMAQSSDGVNRVGCNGVISITSTGDRKVEFIAYENHSLAYVKSALGYPAYYPVLPLERKHPIKAVLMDMDGTTVRSEEFWIWIIGLATASLLGQPHFEFKDADIPYLSGHSVSEHLQYCINKYCPEKSLEEARRYYFMHSRREMDAILKGHGKAGAFTPAPGIKDFLLELKDMKIKIGLVTSGLYEKAYPEIVSAFDTLGLGNPRDFYDCIITAGFALGKGEVGTLGELSPKPHPWLYEETGRVGLGIPFEDRGSVVGIEDSGAGICSIRLAGYSPIGIEGGNIIQSGTRELCSHYCDSFEKIMAEIKNQI